MDKLLVRLGSINKIRFYDIVGIISLSVFANKLCEVFKDYGRADIILLIVSLIAGVSFTLLYYLYSECHQKTIENPQKKSYHQDFSQRVNNLRLWLILLWLLVVCVIITIVVCLLLKFDVIDKILSKFACLPK